METLLRAGLKAEFELRIDDARRAYEAAHAADPADPVATRFLAEFHRHHSGDWRLARQLFDESWRARRTPSRAVALHGLGKMTIHSGEFQRGVAMFEASIAEFPLPLTYRNLAVYWNSEGRFDKAWEYVEQALALAPDDLYNRIFAATTSSARQDPRRPSGSRRPTTGARGVVQPGGDLGTARTQGEGARAAGAALLSVRAFDPVRAREMQEARDDIAFASYHRDADFVALTELASKDPDSTTRRSSLGFCGTCAGPVWPA